MSFNNDDESDGLAALFGGVTPQTDPGPRRAAPAAPEPTPPAAAAPPVAAAPPPSAAAPPPSATQYPGLAPQAPLAYDLPAPAAAPAAAPPASPYGAPSTPGYPGLASPPQYSATPVPQSPQYPGVAPAPAPAPQAQPSYDLPAPGGQQYPGLAPEAPAAPAYPPTAQYPAGLDPAAPPAYQPAPTYQPPPAYQPPAYQPPAYQPPAYQPPAAYEPPPAYEPAPVSPPPAAYDPPPTYQAPSSFPSPDFPPPTSTPLAAEAPVYSPPAGGVYDLPAVAPPPAPLQEPPSYAAPPPAGEPFTAPPVLAEPPRIAEPIERPAPEHPLVRSESAVPATVFPPGPLLPSSTAAVETPEYLERSTAAEKIGLVLAILTGPIGLAVAIANAVRSGRRRGWLIGIVRASLVLGVLSTIAAGIGGYLYWTIRADQIKHAEIAAASAEFCAAAEADPTMVAPPTLGWPAQGASVGESLTLMQAWTDRWTTLAATSPAGLREGLELLADTGQTIVDAVTESRIVDDAANQTQIAQAEAQSGVAGWHGTYCLEP